MTGLQIGSRVDVKRPKKRVAPSSSIPHPLNEPFEVFDQYIIENELELDLARSEQWSELRAIRETQALLRR